MRSFQTFILIRLAFFLLILLGSMHQLSAQLSEVHYLPPLYARDYVGNHYIYVTTPSAANVEVTVKDAAGNLVGTTIVNNTASSSIDLGFGYNANGMISEAELNQVIATKDGLIVEATAPIYVQLRHVLDNHAMTLTSKGKIGVGTNFRAGTAYSTVSTSDRSDFISVMALEDATNVSFRDFTQGVQLVNAGPPTIINVTLNKGEAYAIAAHPNFLNNLFLNGTAIVSDKPIVANVGSWANGAGGFFDSRRDIAAEQILPVSKIGTEYILMSNSDNPDIERTIVVAESDNTSIYFDDGNLFATIDAGAYYIIPTAAYSDNRNHYIRTSKPAYVYQTTGATDYSGGLTILTPLDCWGMKDVVIPNLDDDFNAGTGLISVLTRVGTTIMTNDIDFIGPKPVIGKPDWVTYCGEPITNGDIRLSADDYIQVNAALRATTRGAATYYSDYIIKDTLLVVNLCEQTSYMVGTNSYSETGVYTETLQTVMGCDSIVTLDLTIGESTINEMEMTLCEGEGFDVGNITYMETGLYQDTLPTLSNCDSIIILDLTILPSYMDTVVQTLCYEEVYNGNTYQNDTTIVDVYSTILGCDSTVVSVLSVLPAYELEQDIIICEGERFVVGMNTYTVEGNYVDTLITFNNCNWVIKTNLTVQTPILDEQTITLCEGELYNGVLYDNDISLVEELTTIHGCDSTVVRNLHFDSVKETEVELVQCPGDLYNDVPVFQDETIVTTFQTAEGCDSIVTAHIMMEIFTSLDTIILDEGELYNGIIYTENTLIVEDFQTAEGCDSIAQTQIIINEILTGMELVRLCLGEAYRGVVYERDTTLFRDLTSVNGLDSFVTVNIEVYPTYLDTIPKRICLGEGTIINGQIETESGFYTEQFTAYQQGCDSIVVTALSVVTDFRDSIEVTLCEGNFYNGENYERDTVVTEIFSTAEGCDSTVTAIIDVVENIMTSETVFVAEGNEYNGVIYTQDAFLSLNLQSIYGCDSLAEVQIIVIPDVSTIDTVSLCAGESLNGFPYFENDIVEQTLTASNGGDSIHTTVVLVSDAPFMNFGYTTCFGDSLFAGGAFQTNSGLYTDVYETADGCDSTIYTNLIVAQAITVEVDTFICQGEQFDNMLILRDTFFNDTLTSFVGCDSIVFTTISVGETYLNQDAITLTEGSIFNGTIILNDTLIDNQLTTVLGCDSIVQTQITVLPAIITLDTLNLCEGEVYEGTVLTMDAVFYDTLMASDGADSILITQVDIMPYGYEMVNVGICTGDSIFLAQDYQYETGVYWDTIVAQGENCPTIMETTLQVADQLVFDIDMTICEGDSVALGNNYFKEAGTYSETFTATEGCDSLVNLSLNIAPAELITIEGVNPYCEGESLELNVVDSYSFYQWSTGSMESSIQVSEAGEYTVSIRNDMGCTTTTSIDVPPPVTLATTLETIQPSCINESGGTITVETVQGGNPIYEYAIDNGIFQLENTFANLAAGTYTLQIQDANGCMTEEVVTINDFNENQIELTADTELILGQSTTISATTTIQMDSLSWSPAATLSCTNCLNPEATPEESTLYTLTIIDADGCVVKADIFLRVDQSAQVFMPSAFSPNDDGVNDFFTLYGGVNISEIKLLRIFDRWGNEVFQNQNFAPNDEAQGWNGTYKTKKLNSGVFIFYAEILLIDGTTVIEQGDFVIVR